MSPSVAAQRVPLSTAQVPCELLLTCEHAGNRVPTAYLPLFRGGREALQSHRGWDPGSLALAKECQRRCAAPLLYTAVTRLLVEPNRSVGHRRLFSEFTAPLDQRARQRILDRYYYPHRQRVETWIDARVKQDRRVLHVSFHTFTPCLDGRHRNADVGLLYDPRRLAERRLCDAWHAKLAELRPDLRIRRNYPYLGKTDGFTTHLRKRFSGDQYLGVELEVNQRWPFGHGKAWRQLRRDLAQSLFLIGNG